MFPNDFVWGTATSAYQIEGATRTDGRGETIWDRFAHTAGRIRDGGTGDVACDSYHRYPDDIDLMRRLGVNAYRFSVAWARIYPEGYGRLNRAGLDHYERVVDALLAANITPYVTLFHWDLPQAMQDRGGWTNRDTIAAFAEYADTVSRRLGDRVTHWITHNEPWIFAYLGHITGEHAPGLRDWRTGLQVMHHVLVSHGEAVPVLRANGGAATQAGIALNLSPCVPATDREADLEAAIRYDGFLNRWCLDALSHGAYPDDLLEVFGAYAPDAQPGDMTKIAAPTDFLGINYYSRTLVREAVAPPLLAMQVPSDNAPVTDAGWEVSPEGLYDILTRVQRDYAPPAIYLFENGAADNSAPDATGAVHDRIRLDYLRSHLPEAQRALDAGVPLRGYFHWSLLDNFAWAAGYALRFGLAYTDYATQTRTLKESGDWYARVIADGEVRDA